MSAPKPKVRRVPGDWPAWQWTCCEVESKAWAGWVYAQMEADRHSRTHAAERVADQLDELAGAFTVSSDGGAYWEGYLEGAAQAQRDAAHFIREHLVGGAS